MELTDLTKDLQTALRAKQVERAVIDKRITAIEHALSLVGTSGRRRGRPRKTAVVVVKAAPATKARKRRKPIWTAQMRAEAAERAKRMHKDGVLGRPAGRSA